MRVARKYGEDQRFATANFSTNVLIELEKKGVPDSAREEAASPKICPTDLWISHNGNLKEVTPHGKFGELVEWAYGLKKDIRSNYINVALKFGESSTRVDFSNRVLIELSRPSVSESAREEAAEHDSLTVNQARQWWFGDW